MTIRITEQGLINCFERDTKDAKGKAASCETSAAAVAGDRLLIATDNLPPQPYSQVFSLRSSDELHDAVALSAVSHMSAAWLKNVRKIEEMAVAPEGDMLFFMTDFDWPPEPGNSEPDMYNVLAVSRPSAPEMAVIVAPTINGDVTSSVQLRQYFQRALASETFPDGPPYFKIEGLAALPGRQLLFGVREVGVSYEQPIYGLSILSGGYSVKESRVDIDVATGFKAETLELPEELKALAGSLGLSALAYDADRKGVWIVATSEGKDLAQPHSSYIFWKRSGRPMVLVKEVDGSTLKIPLKIEALVVLPDGSLVGLCDEDRHASRVRMKNGEAIRQSHQGVFVRMVPSQ